MSRASNVTEQEVIAKLDALERAAFRLVRTIQEIRHEFVEGLDD